MNTARQLRRDEAEWLMILSRGRTRKTPFELGIPAGVVESLLRKRLIVRRGCFIEITTHGMADALRLSAPDSSHLEFMSPSRYGDAQLAVRGF
jgi:hypothetical protein